MQPHCICEDPNISANAYRLYGAILRHQRGGTCRATREELGTSAGGMSPTTTWRALVELEEAGLIGRPAGPKKHGRMTIEMRPVVPSGDPASVSDLKHSGDPEYFNPETLPETSVSDLKDQCFKTEILSVSDLKHSGDPILLEKNLEEFNKSGGVTHAGPRGPSDGPTEDHDRAAVAAMVDRLVGGQFVFTESFLMDASGWYQSGVIPVDVLAALRVAESADPPIRPKSLSSFVAGCLPRIKARRLRIEAVTADSVGPPAIGISPAPQYNHKPTFAERKAAERSAFRAKVEAMKERRAKEDAPDGDGA